MLMPKNIKKGSTIGLICPSGPTNKLDQCVAYLKNLGYSLKIGESCYLKTAYLAGDKKIRANDINNMFRDKFVDAIFCLRGGFGSIQCLPYIDYDVITMNPKIFLGYSDITSLHIALNKLCSLITFHGPMPATDFLEDDGYSTKNLFTILSSNSKSIEIINPSGYTLKSLSSGTATGKLVGGNLSVLVSTIGSPYEIDTNDSILFLEDINEPPYKIDRMLHTLKLSKKLENLNGLLIGNFNNCIDSNEDYNLPIEDIFKKFFQNLNIPIICGLMAGHCSPKVTLPLGANITMDSENLRIYTNDHLFI